MEDGPGIYVGTYGHYNNGSLKGKWFWLEDYADKDAFMEAVVEFHGPGEHEFMNQDYQMFPRKYYSESYIDPDLWDWMALDDDDKELLAVYLENVDSDGDIEKARDQFDGKFSSEEDWAENFWQDTGMLSEIPSSLQSYIDYTAYARDCRLGGDMTFVRHEGDVWCFSNNR